MYRKFLLMGVCLLALAGAASAEAVLNRGNDTDPATLDHHHTSTVAEGNVLRDLYDGLTIQDADGKAIPGVAKSWDISEDGTVYTFHLRDNAKWSNGDPVTAGDFQFTFRRLMDPKTAAGYASMLFIIKNAEDAAAGKKPVDQLGVEAVDDHTLKITLNSPAPYFLELLTHQTGFPLHQKSVEANGDKFTTPGKMVTNGAYMLESFTPNDKIVMKKNPYYYEADQVKIDKVNWIPFEDRASCMRRFEAKEVDICSDVSAEQMDYVKKNLSKEFRLAPYLGIYYVDIKGEPSSKLRDPRVRRAISLAADREFMADEVWRGVMLPAYSMVPPGIANYVKDAPKLDFANEDILDREDKAKELLKEAGVEPNTLSVTLRYNTSENHKNTMAAFANMLKNIGINAKLDEVEGTTYFNYLQEKGMFDLTRDGWIGDYNDPNSFLELYTTGNYFNYAEWSNKDYDALMDKSAVTTDLAERAKILAEAEEILLKEGAIVPLMYYSSTALVADRVQGYDDNLMNSHGTRWLSVKN
ncbi:peptide ABC transporter substrate-binding protein [Brucella abortus]|uniref:peptide ABC transporter substrate-binding protein n=1 Tax=Brucella abortus TaxID=235 RepID=UPI000D740B4E|nr:peptide ABC transporter substrate-binding protein [Brucella abortus]PXF92156.1 ABC transporter substrate-binding protein [Brucella abortus]PXF93807.1 ABC transporter substrate-binding protein [Brucella abortus]PXF98645.1 ABC transporter substrate-binding protein [Brucella abortus]PXF98939.1 ABC transporter substrate-binding protein [Brucella abortus]PXG12321.1 ABC transporter substrate-binding protein [Brucella abortus]